MKSDNQILTFVFLLMAACLLAMTFLLGAEKQYNEELENGIADYQYYVEQLQEDLEEK